MSKQDELQYEQQEKRIQAQSDAFITRLTKRGILGDSRIDDEQKRAALQEKTQKAQKSWAQKEQNLQAEAAQLQEKYQKGLITTNDAQAQQQSIEKRVASYQSSAQKEAQALDEENYVFTNRAQDLLHRAVQEINGDKKYKLIINATALIDADSTLNITPAVLAKVNELYAADKKAAKK